MSEFNYKDFLKNSPFLNEVEKKEEEKFSVDKLEKKVKAILKKEGGAVGLKPLVDAAKELGASKKDLMDVLKRMKSVKTHKDGDIIDTDGLKENLNEAVSMETLDRLEGLANIRNLQLMKDSLRMLAADWMQEGFEKEDIKDYVSHLIDNI